MHRARALGGVAVVGMALAIASACAGQNGESMPKDDLSQPPSVPAMNGLVVLFSGKADEVASGWTKRNPNEAAVWKVNEHGALVAGGGDIMSKERFADHHLHIEFKTPWMPDAKGQARGNSGVFVQGRYEVQVLDSYDVAEPGKGDCGAVYNIAAPLVKAYKRPLQWQTYDITFRAPRADDTGKIVENARITVLLNGVCIQNNTELPKVTGAAVDEKVLEPGPLILQDHGNPVQFRNIWVLPLPPKGVDHY